MVGPFDPGHDRKTQLRTAGPALTIKDVVLQQGKEAFHGGIVASSSNSTHRSNQAVAGQRPQEFPASELRSPVAMHDTTGYITTYSGGVF